MKITRFKRLVVLLVALLVTLLALILIWYFNFQRVPPVPKEIGYDSYDGIYHCESHNMAAGGSRILDKDRSRYLLTEAQMDAPVTIIIKNRRMNFINAGDRGVKGGLAIPRIRDANREFLRNGSGSTIKLKKGDLLYYSDRIVQSFSPSTYEFRLIILLDQYFASYSFSNCDKEGGNEPYLQVSADEKKPKTLVDKAHDFERREIPGKREYELSQKVSLRGENDPEKFSLALKSAELEYIPAMIEVGLMYQMGMGTQKDYQLAFNWFKNAVDHGEIEGNYYLAGMYEFGWGVDENWEKAESLYIKSGVKGFYQIAQYFDAQNRDDLAYHWYRESCLLKNLDACGKMEEGEESGRFQ